MEEGSVQPPFGSRERDRLAERMYKLSTWKTGHFISIKLFAEMVRYVWEPERIPGRRKYTK